MVVLVNGKLVQKLGDTTSEGDTQAVGNPTVLISGRPVAFVGSLTTGHEAFPPTTAAQGSTNVLVNGLGVVRAGDAYLPHTDGSRTHTDLAAPID